MDLNALKISDAPLLIHANAVLVANELNVSVFNQLWLVKNGIVAEEDFGPGMIISQAAVVIPARKFLLTVLPDRVQLQPKGEFADGTAISTVFGKLLSLLPHTPFMALGFNFSLVFGPRDTAAFGGWNRRCFSAPILERLALSEDNKPCFGAYFSYDDAGFRAKIDIKPGPAVQFPNVVEAGYPKEAQVMIAGFNFHRDLPADNAAGVALELLPKWAQLFERAHEIAVTLCAE